MRDAMHDCGTGGSLFDTGVDAFFGGKEDAGPQASAVV